MQLSTTAAKGTHTEGEDAESRQVTEPTQTTHDQVVKVPMTIKRVAVSIGVPASYFQKVWREQNPAEPGVTPKTPDQAALDQIRQDETKKIREHVAKLLPTPEGAADSKDLVQVTAFQDITPPPLLLPTTGENTVGWLVENWTTLGMIAVALFGLWMLRSLVRSAAVAVRSEAAPAIQLAAGADEEEEEEQETGKAAVPRLRRFGTTGPSLRDELAQLVQDDPDAAANVLRTWIGTNSSKS
jgi:flagellar M-ring protein FliF